jgi:colanic acid biosynthesis protein WcaH
MTQEIPKKTYQKIHSLVPIVCVDLVIVKNDKVLLCKRTNKPAQGQFWLPGGRIHKGETFSEAVHRKLAQETGLTVQKMKKLDVEETMFEDGPFDESTHTVNVIYLVVPKKGEVKNDTQHDEFMWADTKTKNLAPYVKKYIKIALDK